MRIIKFRVWDGEEMWYPETKTPDNTNTTISFFNPLKGIIWGLYDSKYEYRLASGEYHEIMQFTGLKDSKGKEIYEGDCFKTSNKYSYSSNCIAEVLFENGSFIVHIHRKDLMQPVEFISEYMEKYLDSTEIIGNIYENPELLK